MRVTNVHERRLAASPGEVGRLLDTLASTRDELWPRRAWPRLELDRPLGVGAAGGHGPIRYVVEAYEPARLVRFRFTSPAGFDGFHAFQVEPGRAGKTVLRHALQMTARGRANLSWPFVYRPLHDALLEDALATAQASLRLPPDHRPWSSWVRLLRWVVTRRKPRRVARAA
jgi:hypothetical protein